MVFQFQQERKQALVKQTTKLVIKKCHVLFLRNPWMQAQTIPSLQFCQIICTRDFLLFSTVFEIFGQIFGRMSFYTHLNGISSQNWHWTWTKTTEQNDTDCFWLFRSRSVVELWIVSVILNKRSDPIKTLWFFFFLNENTRFFYLSFSPHIFNFFWTSPLDLSCPFSLKHDRDIEIEKVHLCSDLLCAMELW